MNRLVLFAALACMATTAGANLNANPCGKRVKGQEMAYDACMQQIGGETSNPVTGGGGNIPAKDPSKRRALFWNLVSGMSAMLGGLIAYFALSHVTSWIPDILAFAAASMIYVAVADLIPGLHKTTAVKDSAAQVAFIALGITTIWVIHAVLFPEV